MKEFHGERVIPAILLKLPECNEERQHRLECALCTDVHPPTQPDVVDLLAKNKSTAASTAKPEQRSRGDRSA